MEIVEHVSGRHTYRVYVHPGSHVEIHTHTNGNLTAVKVFKIGDEAAYDSFNLTYTATITSITEKNAIFRVYSGTRRIRWKEFAWRNFDFDAEEIRRQNSEEMTYL